MNLFIGCVFLIICTWFGYNFSLKYKNKRIFYENFAEFNQRFINAVSFSHETILELMEKEKGDDLFYSSLKDKFVNKKSKVRKIEYLCDTEYDFFCSYLNMIGNVDKETQLEYLNSVTDKVQAELSNSILDEKKYKTLYIKVGFLVGLMLFVVVI